MQYVIYVDYRSSYKPLAYEYRPLVAKSLAAAILESDAIHNPDTMYLIRIMVKFGKLERVGTGLKMQAYMAVLEKRSTKWISYDGYLHVVNHFITRFADWFDRFS